MALKPTIYKADVSISDFNRDHYDAVSLTIALHPSETLERMMARLLAYCLNAQSRLLFSKGLFDAEEADIWLKTLDDQIALWIDVGEPTPERVKKSSRLANAVKIYSFNSKSTTWWEQNKSKMAFANTRFYQFDWPQIHALAKIAERTMDWSVTISGDTLYIASKNHSHEVVLRELLAEC